MHYGYEVANQVFRHGGYPPMGGRGGAGIPFHGLGPLPLLMHLMATILVVGVGILIWYFATHRTTKTALAGGWAPRASVLTASGAALVAPADPAESIARERLARGEITAEEFSAIIGTLRRID